MPRVIRTLIIFCFGFEFFIPAYLPLNAHLPNMRENGTSKNVCPFTGADFTMTLITGDRLYLTRKSDGEWDILVDSAGREKKKVSFIWYKDSKKDFQFIPYEIQSLLPDLIDPLFFDIDYLIDNSMDDSHMKYIPIIITADDFRKVKEMTLKRGFSVVEIPVIKSVGIFIPKEYLRAYPDTLWTYGENRLMFAGCPVKRMRLDRLYHVFLNYTGPPFDDSTARKEIYRENALTGKGINIAFLDTGIDSGHPDFSFANGNSKVVFKKDWTCEVTSDPFFCDGTPEDLHGHGTAISGIALGSGIQSSGKYRGIAKDSGVISMKVFNRFGFGLESSILNALERSILGSNMIRGDEPQLEADIISLNFGSLSPPEERDPLSLTVNKLSDTYNIPIVKPLWKNDRIRNGEKNSESLEKTITVPYDTMPPFSEAEITAASIPEYNDIYIQRPDIVLSKIPNVSTCSTISLQTNGNLEKYYTAIESNGISSAVLSGSIALLLEKIRMEDNLKDDLSVKDLLISTSVESAQNKESGFLSVDRMISPQILISPADNKFGVLINNTQPIESHVKIRNTTEEVMDITISCDLKRKAPNEDGYETLRDRSLFSVIPSSLTLGPGATATLTLSIDLKKIFSNYKSGVYSGWLIAENKKKQFGRASIEFIHEGDLQNLNIHGFKTDGSPADHAILYVNKVNENKDGGDTKLFKLNSNGYLQLKTNPGLYNLVLTIWERSTEGNTYFHRISQMEQRIDKKEVNIVFDAQKSKPVSFKISGDPLAANTLQQSSEYFYSYPNGSEFEAGWFIMNGGFDQLSVHTNRAVSKGKMIAVNRWIKTREPSESSPVLYDWVEARDKDVSYDLNISYSNLADSGFSESAYRSDVDQKASYGRLSYVAVNESNASTSVSGIHSFKIPLLRKEFYDRNSAVYSKVMWPNPEKLLLYRDADALLFDPSDHTGTKWEIQGPAKDRWGERPLRPILCAITKKNKKLLIDGFPLMDSNGHGAIFPDGKMDFNIYLYLEDELISFQSDFQKKIEFETSTDDSSIKIQMKLKSDAEYFSPPLDVETQFSFKSSLIQDGTFTVPRINYHLQDFTMDNRVEYDNTLKMSIDLSSVENKNIDLSDCLLKLSSDGGKNWFSPEIALEKPRGLYIETTLPDLKKKEALISINLEILTSNGIRIKEIINDAFIAKKR